MRKIMNNVVPKETIRKIQGETLRELAVILKNSFGPNGSNACIKKENALSRYSKDGHTIIGALHYDGIIEQSIKDDIESITRHIVKTVGDGTTSAVILSSLIFDRIAEMEKNNDYMPSDILKALDLVEKSISAAIKSKSKELDVQDVYDIAMISTNGDEFISNQIVDIYKEFGTGVFIDVFPSTGEDFVVKSYNGMTLNTGYCDSCYVTNKETNTAEVDKPQVYFFEHPIDTREMGVYLDSILSHNIVEPCNSGNYNELVPTVIFAPKISQDMSSLMDSVTASMASMPVNNRLPICIITDYHEIEQLIDLAKMCGAKMIRKYIDPKVYEADVARGAAPTRDTIFEWGGTCDKVVAYSDKTTFVNPSKMRNEDGSYSELYNNLLNFLETEIAKAKEDGENIREVGKLKRRLHSLKSNLVEFYVGGITQADRDALRDLVEDAVLNIRSAATNGVGLGANMSAAVVISEICDKGMVVDEKEKGLAIVASILKSVKDAYTSLVYTLFENSSLVTHDAEACFNECVENAKEGKVFNIREGKYDTNVKTSIMSDITIFNTVCKIVGIMATCNQFIVPTAMHNIYVAE